MFISWSGYGIFAPVIVGVGVFGVTSMTKALCGPQYLHSHPWVMCLGVVLGGFLCWWTGSSMNSEQGRQLVDEKTGRRVHLRRSHTLYGIPMQWWGVVAMVFGVVFAVKTSSTPVQVSSSTSVWESPAPQNDIPQNATASPHLQPAAAAPADLIAKPTPTLLESQQAAVRLYPQLGVA